MFGLLLPLLGLGGLVGGSVYLKERNAVAASGYNHLPAGSVIVTKPGLFGKAERAWQIASLGPVTMGIQHYVGNELQIQSGQPVPATVNPPNNGKTISAMDIARVASMPVPSSNPTGVKVSGTDALHADLRRITRPERPHGY